jgi:hypothetical protein
MANRQNFSRPVRLEIAKRAMRPDGQMACEKCGAVGVRLELHHLNMDAWKSDDEKQRRKLMASDGAFWCIPCHKPETAAQRKILARVEAAQERHAGIRKPSSLRSRGFAKVERERPVVTKIAQGPSAFARQIREDA